MVTTDRYRLTTATATPADGTPADGTPETSPALTRGEIVRALLWALVVISAVSNMAASYGGAGTLVHLACGAVTALSAGTLVVRNLRGRR